MSRNVNWGSGGGGGYSGGGADYAEGGGGGSYCSDKGFMCNKITGGNVQTEGEVRIEYINSTCTD